MSERAELRVPAIEFYQKQIRMCLFSLNAQSLRYLFQTRPRTTADTEGIQRELSPKRLAQIARFVGESGNILPNSIVVNFTPDVRFERSDSSQIGYLIFPQHEGRFGTLLDGQHRLFGVTHEESTEKDLQLPVTGLFLTDLHVAAQVFVSINDNQKPVKKNLLIALQYELGLLPGPEETAAAITERLNEDQDSPLRGRIQMYQNQRNMRLRNDQLIRILSKFLLQQNQILRHYSVDAATKMLKAYLKAIAEIFPEAWSDDRKYYLVRPAGMEVVLPLFPHVRERTRELTPTVQQYIIALDPIQHTQWDAKTFRENRYTSAAGRKDFRERLLISLSMRSGEQNDG